VPPTLGALPIGRPDVGGGWAGAPNVVGAESRDLPVRGVMHVRSQDARSGSTADPEGGIGGMLMHSHLSRTASASIA